MSTDLAMVTDRMRQLRRQILEKPNLLIGLREPPIDAVWGWCQSLTHAIDVSEFRTAKSWSTFLWERRFGSRTEYSKIKEMSSFSEQIGFLRDLYAAYDEWLKAPTHSEALYLVVETLHTDETSMDLLELAALERKLKGTEADHDVVRSALAWANDADPGDVKTFSIPLVSGPSTLVVTRVLAGSSLTEDR